MGAVATTTYVITCDNPNCPGNSLDPASHYGWIQLTAVVNLDGQFPVMSPAAFYCSPACAGTIEEPLAAAEDARNNPPELAVDDPDAGVTEAKTTRTRAKK